MWSCYNVDVQRPPEPLRAVSQFVAIASAKLSEKRRAATGGKGCVLALVPEWLVRAEIGKKYVMAVERVAWLRFSLANTRRSLTATGPGADPGHDRRAPPVFFSLSYTAGLLAGPLTLEWVRCLMGWTKPDRALIRAKREQPPVMRLIEGPTTVITSVPLPFRERNPLVASNASWIVMSQPKLDIAVWAVVNDVPKEEYVVLKLSTRPGSQIEVISIRFFSPGVQYNFLESDTIEVFFTETYKNELVLRGFHVDLHTVWGNAPLRHAKNLVEFNLSGIHRSDLGKPLFYRTENKYYVPLDQTEGDVNLLDLSTGDHICCFKDRRGLQVQVVDDAHLCTTEYGPEGNTSVYSLAALLKAATKQNEEAKAPDPKRCRREENAHHPPPQQQQAPDPVFTHILGKARAVVAGCGLLVATYLKLDVDTTSSDEGEPCIKSTHRIIDALTGATLFVMEDGLPFVAAAVSPFPFVAPKKLPTPSPDEPLIVAI
ncbi:hypothetical protein Pelo_4352 [Pelomyxa schiedti]|nr:hypothetical protein Pelo_4352 [Pelomyxa schiedti]